MNYSKNDFYFFLYNKDIVKAIEYLSIFPEKSKLRKKYINLFYKKKIRLKRFDSFSNEVLFAYNKYYVDVIMNKYHCQIYLNELVNKLNIIINKYSINNQSYNTIDDIEKILESHYKKIGYYFLGGCISGIYGPFIWKETEEVWHEVELPNINFKIKVIFLSKFISKSWLDYISFGKIGISYWNVNKDLYVIKDNYKKSLNKPKYLITFLKYYAQNEYDVHQYGKFALKDLDYRGKLVELIYYPNISRLKVFYENANSDKNDPYSYASYVIIKELSLKLFKIKYVKSFDDFKGKVKDVKIIALDLLNIHTEKISKFYGEIIDII